MSTPSLFSPLGLSIDTGVVTTSIPALTLKQVVNDGGEEPFTLLRLEQSPTTEDENAALVRGFFGGIEVFSIRGGSFIGRSVQVSGDLVAGFSYLGQDTLNLGSKTFLQPDDSNILALRRGQQAQEFRVYATHHSENLSAEFLSLSATHSGSKISTQKTFSGQERELALGVGASNVVRLGPSNTLGFFGAAPVSRPDFGSASAAPAYGANEQAMLNKVYQALRSLGLAS